MAFYGPSENYPYLIFFVYSDHLYQLLHINVLLLTPINYIGFVSADGGVLRRDTTCSCFIFCSHFLVVFCFFGHFW